MLVAELEAQTATNGGRRRPTLLDRSVERRAAQLTVGGATTRRFTGRVGRLQLNRGRLGRLAAVLPRSNRVLTLRRILHA